MESPSRRSSTRRLTEFSLINTLRTRFGRTTRPVVRGIGDDAAVIGNASGEDWLITTDLLAEGIHFDHATASLREIGHRAAIANLSDIAAMGGTPRYLLVSLACPMTATSRQVEALYAGLMQATKPYGMQLVGGDTSASRGGWFLSLTVLGTVRRGRALLRSGARVGDLLYVTGTLGDSRVGLSLLQARGSAARRLCKLPAGYRRFLIGRHLRPTARVSIGQLLARHRLATAVIDLSDGLSGDLRHLCHESRVGAEIDLDSIPLSPACRAFARLTDEAPTVPALAGGEDYELLFTVAPGKTASVKRVAETTGIRLSRIGRITARRHGLVVRDRSGGVRPLPVASYEHFRDSDKA
jgi:thiamine-monophosphate kinase